jgi:hypothetical protein
MGENVASAGSGDGFSVVDAFVDVGGVAEEQPIILAPQSTPAVPMGVGRMMLWFGDD